MSYGIDPCCQPIPILLIELDRCDCSIRFLNGDDVGSPVPCDGKGVAVIVRNNVLHQARFLTLPLDFFGAD